MIDPGSSAHTPAYGEVDLSSCDREPIHVPGAIQPHGVLVALDRDLTVVMVSANCEGLLGVSAGSALGMPMADLVGADLADLVATQVSSGYPAEPLVRTLGDLAAGAALLGVEVDVRVHASGERVVVELEPLSRVGAAALTYQTARGAMARLADAPSVMDLAGVLAREVRSLLLFDRVMVYRFDEDWNGEVIAEEKREELNAFFGLHYPATDIPAQARRLYTVNWTRLIVDIGYHPVPLHPVLDPGTGAPLDQSQSSLRSVSPIHIEYLSNIDITASMSISLVIDGELWGLVACHHYSGPHRPAHEARAAAEFLGQVASQLVAARERADARDAALATQTAMSAVAARISASPESPLKALLADPGLLELMDAQGAALCYDGVITTRGEVVEESMLRRISAALEDPDRYATATDRLRTLSPALADLPPSTAGALRIGSAPDRWLLWLRPEFEQVVDWGGDPTNKRIAETEGPEIRLSPRKSFDKWRQVVGGRSEPWTRWQLASADALGKHMIGLLLMRSREQIAMAESVQRSVVLDRAPTFPGVEITARYLPASNYQLGGDWWDAFELPDGRLAFAVGDVAGHGVSAASAMTQVRTALRAYLFEGHDPAVCLDRLDRLMSGLLDQRVATAVVAVADRAAGTVELASAGHPAPLLVRGDTAVEVEIDARPLLGVGAGTGGVTVLPLLPGSTLLLYTDGVVERRGADTTERTAQLAALAAGTHVGTDLDAWVDRLLQVAEVVDDDTTMLAIRLIGS